MKVRVRVYISGRVQGVFFRAETADLAQRLGLAGWVRNLSDGRVEAVFEGERDKVEKAIDFCRRGPPGAHVTDFDLKWEELGNEAHDFTVRY